VDIFIGGIGAGGMISDVGRSLKEKYPDLCQVFKERMYYLDVFMDK
jgi:cysteine synthase